MAALVPLGRSALGPVESQEAILTDTIFQLPPGAFTLQLGPDGSPKPLQVLSPLVGPPGVPGPLGQLLAQSRVGRRGRVGSPGGRGQLRFELTDALQCADAQSELQAGGPALEGRPPGARRPSGRWGSTHGGEICARVLTRTLTAAARWSRWAAPRPASQGSRNTAIATRQNPRTGRCKGARTLKPVAGVGLAMSARASTVRVAAGRGVGRSGARVKLLSEASVDGAF